MKKPPISWLYGLEVFGQYGNEEIEEIRSQMLEVTEGSFLNRTTTLGGVRTFRELDINFDHYSLVSFGPGQLPALVEKIRSVGFGIHNIEDLYLRAPLPEFRAIFQSAKGPVEIVFARPKSTFQSMVQTTPLAAFFDCPIDVYFIYWKRRGQPRGALRISRMAASYEPGRVSFCQIYAESMGESFGSAKQMKKQINFYQDTGIRFYSLYLAVQYAILCDPNFLVQTRVRTRHLFIHDPNDPKKRPTRVETSVPDYIFGDVGKFKPVLLAPAESGVWNRVNRLFSKKHWIYRLGVFNVSGFPVQDELIVNNALNHQL